MRERNRPDEEKSEVITCKCIIVGTSTCTVMQIVILHLMLTNT